MPIGLSKAPQVLSKAGRQLWVDTFNGVFDSCTDGEKVCDERSAKIAWSQVRKRYKKVGDKWVLKETAKAEIEDPTLEDQADVERGGRGSGDWGHTVRPGKRGGSGGGGGLKAIGAKPGSSVSARRKASKSNKENRKKEQLQSKSTGELNLAFLTAKNHDDRINIAEAILKKGGFGDNTIARKKGDIPTVSHDGIPSIKEVGSQGKNAIFKPKGGTFQIGKVLSTQDGIFYNANFGKLQPVTPQFKMEINEKVFSTKSETEAYSEVELVITKASLQSDGTMRWQAVTSDTEVDKATERTSLALFRDWIERIDYGLMSDFLPDEPQMPFLGLSHYPALDDGSGKAGETARLFTDGNQFKAGGSFHSDEEHPIGPALFESVRQERALIKKGEMVEKPIRISAGWWDLQHSHGEFIFNRKSLIDICPMCVKGVGDKVYLKGQLDHFAATRVPMNPRTNLELEEKSMATTTRVQDASSIIDPELAEELDRKAKLIGKADAEEELPEAMAVRAGHKDEDDKDKKRTFGDFLKNRRGKKKMTLAALAKTTGIDERDITDFETNKRRPGKRMVDLLAEGLDLDEDELMEMLPESRGGHRDKDKDKDKKHRKSMNKAETEDGPDVERDHGEGAQVSISMPPRPFGGATSIDEAEDFMEAQETLVEMHSNWDVFRMVIGNILAADPEQEDDKVGAMSQAIDQFGQRINALKASLADAYLLQSAAAVDETPAEVEIFEDTIIERSIAMSDEAQITETHPADVMKAAIDTTLANGSLTMETKTEAVQDALNIYTTSINKQMERDDPTQQAKVMAQAMAGALAEVMNPLQEAIGLLNAKLGDQATQPQAAQVALPQQKSFVAQPAQQPVPVGNQGQLPISPITGKPSTIRAAIERTTY